MTEDIMGYSDITVLVPHAVFCVEHLESPPQYDYFYTDSRYASGVMHDSSAF